MDEVLKFNQILKSFKLKSTCINYNKIRNISLYDLVLEPGVKVKDIIKFSTEIALVLKAQEKPLTKILSDKGIVRLEFIDEKPQTINFLEEIRKMPKPEGAFPMYLGCSTNGENISFDMAKNPHLLIGGSTGGGKSALLNNLIANCLIYNDVELFLCDTKKVEFNLYKNYFSNVNLATNYLEVIEMLNSLNEEMELRYNVMSNRFVSSNNDLQQKFKQIILIIDEFSDLTCQDTNKELHKLLIQLTQKSRAAGIYCVIATQRPSHNIINGDIKVNFTARISCKMASGIDSKIILGDSSDAQYLGGMGDSLIKNYKYNNLERFQAAYITPEQVVNYFKGCA